MDMNMDMNMGAPTFGSVWTQWTFAPIWDLLIVLATAGYLRLAARAGTNAARAGRNTVRARSNVIRAGSSRARVEANGVQSEAQRPQAGAPDSQAGVPDPQAGAPDSQAGVPGPQAGLPDSQAGRGGWPMRRTVAFLTAMALLAIALNSSMAVYSHSLFWVHMLQHLLLIMVIPVLAVWGQPWRLLGEAGGPRGAAFVDRVLGSVAAKIIVNPVLATGLYAAVIVLTHLTGFQQAMQNHMWIHDTETVVYLVSGYLLFWPLTGTDRSPVSIPYLLRFALLAVTMGVDTLVGVALMLTTHALAPGFKASHPGWGGSAVSDQSLAGAVMWFGGDGLMMILMIITAVRWGRDSNEDAGLGNWLEGVRRRSMLGADELPDDDDQESGVDSDQRALDAYNRTLAALNDSHRPPGR